MKLVLFLVNCGSFIFLIFLNSFIHLKRKSSKENKTDEETATPKARRMRTNSYFCIKENGKGKIISFLIFLFLIFLLPFSFFIFLFFVFWIAHCLYFIILALTTMEGGGNSSTITIIINYDYWSIKCQMKN